RGTDDAAAAQASLTQHGPWRRIVDLPTSQLLAMSRHTRASTRRTPGQYRDRADPRVFEEMLRDSESRLQCVLNLSTDYYWEQDENHRFTLLLHKGSSKN